MDLRVQLCTPCQKAFRVGWTAPLRSANDEGKPGSSGAAPARCVCITLMRLTSHITIPRNFPSARPLLFPIPGSSRRLLNPISVAPCVPYSPLYNSTLANTPTTSANVDSNVVIQRVPSESSQPTPMREYKKLVEAGTLRSDDYQTEIIQKLQALHDALALYHPPTPPGPPSLVNVSSFPFPA